jgi:light-independent protochlorophyllide reductase subunit B
VDAKGDVMLADVNHYRVNELQAAEPYPATNRPVLHRQSSQAGQSARRQTEKPSVNIIGISSLASTITTIAQN